MGGYFQNSSKDTVAIDYSKLKNFKRIILIDDVITKGNSVSEFATKIKNNFRLDRKSSPAILVLSLGRTVKAEEVEAEKFSKNKNYLDVLSLKGKGSIKISEINIQNLLHRNNSNFLKTAWF